MQQRDSTPARAIMVPEAMALQAITAGAVTTMGARATLMAADTLTMEGHTLTGLEHRMDITPIRIMAAGTIRTPTMAADTIRIRTMAVTPPDTRGIPITSLATATTQRQSRRCNSDWVSSAIITGQSME